MIVITKNMKNDGKVKGKGDEQVKGLNVRVLEDKKKWWQNSVNRRYTA